MVMSLNKYWCYRQNQKKKQPDVVNWKSLLFYWFMLIIYRPGKDPGQYNSKDK